MNYTKEELKKDKSDKAITKTVFTIKVDEDVIKKSHLDAVKHLGKNKKVAGFRQGHVPLNVLEKSINPALIADEEINRAINQTIIDLINKERLQLLEQPAVEVSKYVPNQTLEIKATVESVAPIKLVDPKKLTTKLKPTKVDKKDIDSVLERLRNSAASKKTVKRAAKKGDEVIIDFTGLKDDKEFEGGKAKDYPLNLGSNAFIPGFEDGIIGHKAGEKFDIDVTFPKSYGVKELSGKKAVFKINLKEVKELELPKLDDKFAKTISPDFKTLDALQKDIENELKRTAEQTNQRDYQEALLEELASKSKIKAPSKLVDSQIEDSKKQFEQNLMYRGLDLASYLKQQGLKENEWQKKELIPAIEKRIINTLALTQLAIDYDVTVGEDELLQKQAERLSHYSDPKIRKHFETKEALRQLKSEIHNQKTLAKLVELANK